MTWQNFLKEKSLLLLLHLTCMGLLAGFLRLTDYNRADTALILIFWLAVLLIWLTAVFLERRKYFREAEQILEHVEQRYLLGELMPDSYHLEDRLYRDMLRRSNKSVLEQIRKMEEEQRDYREYIESWVHEVKAPITAIELLCENRRKEGEHFCTISVENQKIENYVDMALFYARSEEVYKDYLIRETNLEEIVYEVLKKNRLYLIQNQVRAEVDCGAMVYTDRKWIAFMLNQILLNSVKYKRESPVIVFRTERGKNGVVLLVEDNGVGIAAEEISRIFEKGFTGSNGREGQRSTGMGLYLCRRLCDKLGIGISASSEYGRGTTLRLEFPISHYIARK